MASLNSSSEVGSTAAGGGVVSTGTVSSVGVTGFRCDRFLSLLSSCWRRKICKVIICHVTYAPVAMASVM